jgi:hypothetical protein
VNGVEFVGVRNSAEKARLLARGTSRRERVLVRDLAYDCLRHLDFLERLDGPDDPSGSLYWRYLVWTGHTPASADERCARFAGLTRQIESEGLDSRLEPIAVTDDGIRLNGSHRAAIARHLGVDEVEVDVYSWNGAVPGRRARRVVDEAEVKRAAQRTSLGRTAHDRAGGGTLGRVAFVDAEVPGRLGAALGRRARPLLVIERPGGELESRPPEAVTLT